MTEPREESGDDAKRAAICAAGLGLALTIGALAFSGGRASLSVFVGSFIAVANLLTMRAIIRAIVREPDGSESTDDKELSEEEKAKRADAAEHREAGQRGGAAWGLFALIKIVVLFGGVWMLLTKGLVDPIPLVVGYGVLPLGIAASTLIRGMSPRRR